VYGTLRPGELAYRHIAALVEHAEPAVLHGWQLTVRDGLPLARPQEHSRIVGDLLCPQPDARTDLADAISAYEGTDLYARCVLAVSTASGHRSATVYIGKRPRIGNPVDHDRSWRSVEDPLLSSGLDAVAKLARDHFASVQPMPADMSGFWEAFVPLQGLYLTLCSILERYTSLVFGPAVEPTRRVASLRDDPDAQLAIAETHPPEIRVVDSRDPESAVSAPGRKAFDAWYQARSNLSHRGKAAYTDFWLIERSLVGLHDALRRLIELQLKAEDQPAHPVDETQMLGPVYDRFRRQ
jgi:gamma-glutamylcyclotransferase (GGCT)/AIG2-like uncharacterized protein YtfP